jgi:hypothetical protein
VTLRDNSPSMSGRSGSRRINSMSLEAKSRVRRRRWRASAMTVSDASMDQSDEARCYAYLPD